LFLNCNDNGPIPDRAVRPECHEIVRHLCCRDAIVCSGFLYAQGCEPTILPGLKVGDLLCHISTKFVPSFPMTGKRGLKDVSNPVAQISTMLVSVQQH
jgi:hypothetical protein